MTDQTKSEPIAKLVRLARKADYHSSPLARKLLDLLQTKGENMREASLASRLDHQALRRLIDGGSRPDMITCIMLADHFRINPNTLLALAGWPELQAFNKPEPSGPIQYPDDVKEVARTLSGIPDPAIRVQVSEAIKKLVGAYFEKSDR